MRWTSSFISADALGVMEMKEEVKRIYQEAEQADRELLQGRASEP